MSVPGVTTRATRRSNVGFAPGCTGRMNSSQRATKRVFCCTSVLRCFWRWITGKPHMRMRWPSQTLEVSLMLSRRATSSAWAK